MREAQSTPRSLAWARSRAGLAAGEYVRRAVERHPAQIVAVILYGSQARGDAADESDLDLLVVVRDGAVGVSESLIDIGWSVQYEYGVVLSELVRTLQEWRQMAATNFPFYRTVVHEGVILWTHPSAPTLN